MNPIEAAAQQILHLMPETPDCDWDGNKPNPFCERCQEEALEYMKVGLLAFFRAAFGCPQCGGYGDRVLDHHYATWGVVVFDCPAKHVEITVLGVTIWADPDKCEWRCEPNGGMCSQLSSYGLCLGRGKFEMDSRGVPLGHDPKKFGCGWQPRMDLLMEGLNNE